MSAPVPPPNTVPSEKEACQWMSAVSIITGCKEGTSPPHHRATICAHLLSRAESPVQLRGKFRGCELRDSVGDTTPK